MGLFKGIGNIFTPERVDALAAAQATLNGDYAGAATIRSNSALRRQQMQERLQAEAQRRQLDAVIDGDPALATPQARAYARANPKAYTAAYLNRLQSRAPGAAGGVADASSQSWAGQSGMAPAPVPTAPGQNAAPGPIGAGPSDEAVSHLRQFPHLAPHFDLKFGPGASSQFLGNGAGGGQYPF